MTATEKVDPVPPARIIRAYRRVPPGLFPGGRLLVRVLDCGHESLVVDRPGLPAVGEVRRCFACVGMGGVNFRHG